MKFTPTHPSSIWKLLGSGLFLGVIQPLAAGSLLQPTGFNASNAGSPYVGTGSEFLAPAGFFTATLDPFPSALGALTSFTVKCEIRGQLSGSVAADAESGNAFGALGGTFFINGSAFNGTGGSNGTGAGPGGELAVEFGIPTFEQTLTTANAGVTYDPAILATVTGQSAFQLSFSSGVTVGFSNVAELNASVVGTISLTYGYLAAGSGEGRNITVTGILRNSATGDVTVQWESESDATYGVDVSENLSDWTVIERIVPGGAPTTSFTEVAVPATVARRFYRIRERP